MNIITTVLGATALALTTTGIAAATPMAPHESTYHGPAGFELTLGHTDQSYRQVPALNAMPTNREVFLDNTAYVTAPAGATGGPLNIYSWATVTATTPQVSATNSVFGDTMFL
ncbi:MspA family porin [Nocardia asteroides]|uniref:MspA family porin n=1 Tax=Nocardia asteroides TaxID=1824 RepID=UPI0033E454ED